MRCVSAVRQCVEYTKPPHGSVLKPQLFSIYSAPLGKIIKAHCLEYHFYADDTQVYFSFSPSDVTSDDIVERIVRCIADIQHWMDTNFLKLNYDKTEAIFGLSHRLKKVSVESIPVGDASIIPSSRAKNLGIMQDSSMSMAAHISRVCSAAHLHLRNIRARIRPFLSHTTTEQLVHVFVTSRFDTGNALLCDVT